MAESTKKSENQTKKSANTGTHTMSLRDRLFADTAKGRVIRQTLSNGEEVEMREPTKGERNHQVALARDENDVFDPMGFMVRIAVKCSFVPDTDSRIFYDEDIDEILKLQKADWVDELVDMARQLVGVGQEDMRKN